MRPSRRVRDISPSPTMAIDALTKELQSQGVDVINLSVGEPDFDTPEHVKRGAATAMERGQTKYTPAAGTLELRRAISEKFRRDNGLEYEPGEIVVSNGAKQSLYNAYLALCEPGDEVILQAPYWVSYPEIIKLAGGVPVVVETTASEGFRMSVDQIRAKLTPRTRIINLNSPSNPTGAVYSEPELRAIAELAVERDLLIVTDEIYEHFAFGRARHVSIASFGRDVWERTVTINGFSKAYAMTGWRLGYAAAPAPVARAMADLQGHCTSGPSSISQAAGVAALVGPQGPLQEMVREFDRRRRRMAEGLGRLPHVDCPEADGAFYLFPDVSGWFGRTVAGRAIESAEDFCRLLLEQARVAAVPGDGFGAPRHVRFSYAAAYERIEEALRRMGDLLG